METTLGYGTIEAMIAPELADIAYEGVPLANIVNRFELTPNRYVPEISRVHHGPEVLGSAYSPKILVARPDYVQTYSPVGTQIDNRALFDRLGAPTEFREGVLSSLQDLGITTRYHSDFDRKAPVEDLMDRALAQLVYAAVPLVSMAIETFKRMNPSIVQDYPYPGKLIVTTSYPVSPLLTDIIMDLVSRQHRDLDFSQTEQYLYILACNGGLKALRDTFVPSNSGSPWSVVLPIETAFSLGLTHTIDWGLLATPAGKKEVYRQFIESAAFSQGATAVAILNSAYQIGDVVEKVKYDRKMSLCGPQLFKMPPGIVEDSYVYGRPPGDSTTVVKTVKMPPYPPGDYNQMAIYMNPALTGILFSNIGAEVGMESLQADLPFYIEQVRRTGKPFIIEIVAHQPSLRVLTHIVDKINLALTRICEAEGIVYGPEGNRVGMIQVRAAWNLDRLGQGNMSSPTTLFNAAEYFAEMLPNGKLRLLSLGAWSSALAMSIQRKTM